MDIETTMQFILEHQVRFEENFARLEETDRKLAGRLDNLTSVAASLVLSAQAQQASIEELRTQWRGTLDRFDAWMRGRQGDGH
jgi:hypothetical protein